MRLKDEGGPYVLLVGHSNTILEAICVGVRERKGRDEG